MTNKVSKKEMFNQLKAMVDSNQVSNKNWVERAKYAIQTAVKDLKKVTAQDFADLIEEAKELINGATLAPVENSPKPAKKPIKKAKKTEETAETVEETAEPEEQPKKKSGKSLKAPKAKVEDAPKLSKKSRDLAKIFPATIEVKDLGTLEARNNEFNTMAELTEALNEGREIYIAAYWTPRHIKEFAYGVSNRVNCPKSFENDLDIMMAVVTCTNVERVWCMSAYTEAMMCFEGEDLEPVADKDENGNEYHIRVANGLEFEIYEKIAD